MTRRTAPDPEDGRDDRFVFRKKRKLISGSMIGESPKRDGASPNGSDGRRSSGNWTKCGLGTEAAQRKQQRGKPPTINAFSREPDAKQAATGIARGKLPQQRRSGSLSSGKLPFFLSISLLQQSDRASVPSPVPIFPLPQSKLRGAFFCVARDRDHSAGKKNRLMKSCGIDQIWHFTRYETDAAPNPFWVSGRSSTVFATRPSGFSFGVPPKSQKQGAAVAPIADACFGKDVPLSRRN